MVEWAVGVGTASGDSGVKGVGGKWVREEHGGGAWKRSGSGGMVGNGGWGQGVGIRNWGGRRRRVGGMRTDSEL